MRKQKLLVVLVLLPVVCSLFFSVGSVSGYDLELDDYAHYKVIAYEAGVGAGVDYQVVVVVHYGIGTDGTMDLNNETVALLHVGDIQADFDDVRFANQFGEVLTHKRCSYTSAVNATFVVKVEANLDVDQLVYVYYGNGAAVDASSDNALVDVISGVVGAWNLDEAVAGDVIDYSGNANNGVPTGTTVVDGKYLGKKARYMNGTELITITHNAAYNFAAMTIVANLKADNPQADWARLFGKGWGVGNGSFTSFYWPATTNLYFTTGDSGGQKNSFVEVPFTVFHQFAGLFQKTAANEAYCDATDGTDSAATANENQDIAQDLVVGGGAGGYAGIVGNLMLFNSKLNAAQLTNMANNYPDVTFEAGKVYVRKWATTTLPAVAGVSDAVDNAAFSPVVDGALTDTEWFVAGLILVLALVNIVLLVFPFALLRFVFGVLSFALSAWAFTYVGLPLAPYLQIMGLVVSVLGMFLATRARE